VVIFSINSHIRFIRGIWNNFRKVKRRCKMSRRIRSSIIFCFSIIFAIGFFAGKSCFAEEKRWWPFPVVEFSKGTPQVVEYIPLEKAAKKWNIVTLLPHLKDTSWVTADYGLVLEAKRLGVKLTILDAGGYDNLNKQLSQYDDAMAMKADAIISGVISEGGLTKKFEEGMAKGIVNIGLINPIYESKITATVYNDVKYFGAAAADVVVEEFKNSTKVRVAIFPGPAGSGWAEDITKAFRDRLDEKAKGKFEILTEKYGDAGKSVQLKLVEDVLQAYDNIDLLYGCNPMAEVAINVLKEAGQEGKTKIMASYETPDLLPAIRKGDVIGMISEQNVAIARICVDLAIRALEKKPTGFSSNLQPLAKAITKDNIQTIPLDWAFAPDDYQPVYKVD
jgi:protein TorT